MSMGKELLTLCWMVFMHCIGDYTLQKEFLATYKQKSSWEEYVKINPIYKDDWIVVLLVHSFIWAFCIQIPTMIHWWFTGRVTDKAIVVHFICIVANTIIHAIIDHLKCNKQVINLYEDQMGHMLQIATTLLVVYVCIG